MSPYIYTFNNPINLTDPSGMEPDDPPTKANRGDFVQGDIWSDSTGDYVATNVTDNHVTWSTVKGDSTISQSRTEFRSSLGEFFNNLFNGIGDLANSYSWQGNAPQEFYHIYSSSGMGRDGNGDRGFYKSDDKIIDIDFDAFVGKSGWGGGAAKSSFSLLEFVKKNIKMYKASQNVVKGLNLFNSSSDDDNSSKYEDTIVDIAIPTMSTQPNNYNNQYNVEKFKVNRDSFKGFIKPRRFQNFDMSHPQNAAAYPGKKAKIN